jgi:hypothetical protein
LGPACVSGAGEPLDDRSRHVHEGFADHDEVEAESLAAAVEFVGHLGDRAAERGEGGTVA